MFPLFKNKYFYKSIQQQLITSHNYSILFNIFKLRILFSIILISFFSMNFFILLHVLLTSLKIKYSYGFYNIPTFTQAWTVPVSTTTTGVDPCRLFQIRNSTLYRMGQSNIISSWNLDSFAYTQQRLYQTLDSSINVSNLAIGYNEAEMVATLKSVPPKKIFDTLDPLTFLKTQSYNLTANATFTTIKVIPTQIQYIQLLYSSSNTTNNTIFIYNKNMIFVQNLTLPIFGMMNATICEDQSAFTVWDLKGTTLFIQNKGSVWVCNYYHVPFYNNLALNGVTMSKNGSIVVMQYDSLNTFFIINFRSPSVVSLKNFSNTIINQAIFLDEDCHLIALTVNYTTLQIYDTFTLTLQSSTVFSSVSNYSVIDYSLGTLYFCLPSSFQVFNILCPSLSYRSTTTNECINCSLPSNCNGCYRDTGICNSCDQNYTLNSSTFQCQPGSLQLNISNSTNSSNPINATALNNYTNSTNNIQTNIAIFNPYQQNEKKTIFFAQSIIVNVTLETFNAINPIITTIFSIIQMSPFTLLFLNFMSYWNLCCLYSILDVKVPEYLPEIHEKIFQAIQTSIFQNLGFSPKAPSLDNQNVPSNYFMINYNISFDFINPNLQNVLMLLFVLTLLLTTTIFKNYFLKKSSFLYKLLTFSIIQTLIGQFISFVPFSLLPYRFLVNKTGVLNFSQKINLILQVFLLIMCLIAPCIFIWSKSQTYFENKVKKCRFFKETPRNQVRQIKKQILNEKIKFEDKQIEIQNFKELQMLLVNISVPFLVILPLYIPFFIVNFSMFLYGIKIASKSNKYRINSIMSACYFPLYHTCYIIFFLFGQNELICHYVGLFCLVVLFLGGIHQLCNVVFISLIDFCRWLIKILKEKQKLSKISNQQLNTEIKNEKPSLINLQSSIINISAIIEDTKSYNQIQQYKNQKIFKLKLKKNNQQKDQVIKEDMIKSKVKGIKFKIQRTYKKGLDISQTMKPLIKNVQKLQNSIIQTSNVIQEQAKTQKKTKDTSKNDQRQQDAEQTKDNFNSELNKFNQMLKRDYILRKQKTGKNIPRYIYV